MKARAKETIPEIFRTKPRTAPDRVVIPRTIQTMIVTIGIDVS